MSIKNDLIKYTPRPEQTEALDFIKKTKKDKPDTKFFLMNLPVGIGKSHLAVMISDWYTTQIDRTSKVDIITAGKILQDQYDDTYESIKNLKGKENYSCGQYACPCAQGKEFNKLNKTKCDDCPYDYAKNSFIGGKVSLTNFHLYLIYSVYSRTLLDQRGAKLLIVDECLHPETEIAMYDGSKKMIKDIVEGELVLTVNEETKQIEVKPVVKLHHNINKGAQMYEIEMENGDILKITGNHKVKLIDGTWKKAEDLNESDEILFINEIESHEYDGCGKNEKKFKTVFMKIKSIKRIDYKDDVYNLHIKDNHNYFANNHCVSNCHELDDVMSDFVSIRMTENTIKKYKFGNESEILNNFRKVSNITNYVEFLKYIHQEIIRNIESVEASMSDTDRPKKQDKRDLRLSKVLGTGPSGDIKLMQLISDMKQFQLKVEIFLKEYLENQHNWVLETTRNEKTGQTELSMEPIWASDYLDKYVWSHYDMVIMMSGTILNRNIFSDLNGFDVDRSVYYSIASPFPRENRPIYYMPLGKMSYTKKEDTFKNYVPYLHKLFKKYEMKKGIIHTNSFEISRWIQKDVSNARLIFHDSTNKEDRLRHHFESKDPTIFVSPSVGTGVSFDHEKSRFQIISKIPYPSLSSQKNKLRQKNNPEWYSWKTCSNLIQMTGRSIRSNNDFADTIILDGSFSDVLRYSSQFLPEWFQEAIKKIEVKTTT